MKSVFFKFILMAMILPVNAFAWNPPSFSALLTQALIENPSISVCIGGYHPSTSWIRARITLECADNNQKSVFKKELTYEDGSEIAWGSMQIVLHKAQFEMQTYQRPEGELLLQALKFQ